MRPSTRILRRRGPTSWPSSRPSPSATTTRPVRAPTHAPFAFLSASAEGNRKGNPEGSFCLALTFFVCRCGVAESAALGWRHSEQPTRVCRSRYLLPEERADPSGPGQPALRVTRPALHLHVLDSGPLVSFMSFGPIRARALVSFPEQAGLGLEMPSVLPSSAPGCRPPGPARTAARPRRFRRVPAPAPAAAVR